MQRVEHDLGSRLDWVAVDHWDTDNPHTHLVLRGKDQGGAPTLSLPATLAARKMFHVEQGLAERRGGRVIPIRDVVATLQTRELERISKAIATETGLTDRQQHRYRFRRLPSLSQARQWTF